MGLGTTMDDKNMYNETYLSLYNRFESMKKRILKNCSDEVTDIIVMQECQFLAEMRKVGSSVHQFFND